MNVNQHLPRFNRGTKIPNHWKVYRVKQSFFQSMLALQGVLDGVKPTKMYGHLRQISLFDGELQHVSGTYWHIDHLEKRFCNVILDTNLTFKSFRSWPHRRFSMTNFQAMIFGQKMVLQIPGWCTPWKLTNVLLKNRGWKMILSFSHRIHVGYIYSHLADFYGKCR